MTGLGSIFDFLLIGPALKAGLNIGNLVVIVQVLNHSRLIATGVEVWLPGLVATDLWVRITSGGWLKPEILAPPTEFLTQYVWRGWMICIPKLPQ